VRQRCFTSPAPVIIGMREFFWRPSRCGLEGWLYSIIVTAALLFIKLCVVRGFDEQVMCIAMSMAFIATYVVQDARTISARHKRLIVASLSP